MIEVICSNCGAENKIDSISNKRTTFHQCKNCSTQIIISEDKIKREKFRSILEILGIVFVIIGVASPMFLVPDFQEKGLIISLLLGLSLFLVNRLYRLFKLIKKSDKYSGNKTNFKNKS